MGLIMLAPKNDFTGNWIFRKRLNSGPRLQRVLDTFHETGSRDNQTYKFTVNASYQLALIRDYLAEGA
jgi:hypothetical protein